MKMKKLTLAIAAIALCAAAAAQTTQEEFQTRYERLVRNLGYDGVGIETLLDRWEEAFPDDAAVPVARFNYYFYKGRRTEVVARPGLRRYLGQEPTLTLKDSDGNDVNYFEESFYDEDLFGEAMKILDAQIAAHPDELRWQYMRITALAAYEKESPDMAAAALKQLIMRHATAHPAWTLDGEPAGADIFQQGVGEYCANFFEMGTEAGYEYFREISELMTKYFPRNSVFVANLGSYWFVAKGNDKQAAKYYKKALKIDPDDEAASRNLKIIERRQAQAKGKKK
jgi:tetratricopeptide (TPR) repeat protein